MERGEDNMREKLRVESQVVRGSRSYQNCASTRVFFFFFYRQAQIYDFNHSGV